MEQHISAPHLEARAAGALVAIKLRQVVEAAALLAEALADALPDDGGDLEVVLADLVALVVLLERLQRSGAALHL